MELQTVEGLDHVFAALDETGSGQLSADTLWRFHRCAPPSLRLLFLSLVLCPVCLEGASLNVIALACLPDVSFCVMCVCACAATHHCSMQLQTVEYVLTSLAGQLQNMKDPFFKVPGCSFNQFLTVLKTLTSVCRRKERLYWDFMSFDVEDEGRLSIPQCETVFELNKPNSNAKFKDFASRQKFAAEDEQRDELFTYEDLELELVRQAVDML